MTARWFDRVPWRARAAGRDEQADAVRRPASQDGVVIGAESIELRGSRTHAALLIHGFNDTPQSLGVFARAVHQAGWTVSVPRLPGHGCTLPHMVAHARAEEWTTCVRDTYVRLRHTHDVVVVCGLSMGGALAATLAAEYPDIPALVLLAPYIGVPRLFGAAMLVQQPRHLLRPYLPGSGGSRSLHDPAARKLSLAPGMLTVRMLRELREVAERAEQLVPQLSVPTLYLQSREDNRISVEAAERNFRLLGSASARATVREQRWLTGCGHIITADYCRDEVARQVIEWFACHAGAPEPSHG